MNNTFRIGQLKDIIEFNNGKAIKKNGGSIPIFGGNGILGYCSEHNYENTLIIGRVGAYCGSVHISNNECWVSDNAIAALPKESSSNLYNYYLLKSLNLNALRIGSSQPLLTQGILKNVSVKIEFDKIKQKNVALTLAALDKKIKLNNQINGELEAMAKTLYDYWFVQFDFPDAEGKPYKSSGGKMVYNAKLKHEIPEAWENGSLDDIGQVVGGSTPSTSERNNFADIATPWITPNDLSKNQGNKFISRGAQDVTADGIRSASLKTYPTGTVLLSSRAPIGYMAIAQNPLTTNQGFKSFIPNKGYSTEFVYYSVKNNIKAIEQYSSGSTFKEISGSVLKTVKTILPELKVVDDYTAKVADIFARQNNLELENQQLSSLRDWLLPMLMNGQVTVN